ncbi:hypothetical protein HC752_09350 [Vibrio sp. S9_S30]|nr:hypothetical protein [Vibrio sp. S9_S30]
MTNLGVPAFNLGSKVRTTGDFDNGLGVLINGVQYVYIFVDQVGFDYSGTPKLELRFVFYDVFGLDDDDLKEYGTKLTTFGTSAAKGINAWWQLQHQFNFKPLITRIVLKKQYTFYNQIFTNRGLGYGFAF